MPVFLRQSAALLSLGIAYAFLFQPGALGLNVLLFDALLIGLTLRFRPELASHRGFVWSIGGLLFAAGSLLIVNGIGSRWAHHLTFLLVLGFAQERELRFVWFALLLGAINLAQGPFRWLGRFSKARREHAVEADRERKPWLNNVLAAVIISLPFLVFYALGNPQFEGILGWLGDSLAAISLGPKTIWNFVLCLFGMLLSITLLFPRRGPSALVRRQAAFTDELGEEHSFTSASHPRPRPRVLSDDPRDEYRQSVLVFGLLNVLLAVVNVTDLSFVWINNGALPAATLSRYVHEGTTSLTLSILLAMAVVLYYFRGDLNFLKSAPALRPLARVWLAQNALLALSVGVRNWHYIDAYGLALGRVYVAFALGLILFGLFTLWRKIDRKLSLTYLLQTNGMACWLALLLFGAVNWPGVMTRYNLATQQPTEIDWEYLSRRANRHNHFLLLAHPDYPNSLYTYRRKYYAGYTDWRSWNYADWRNFRALRQTQ